MKKPPILVIGIIVGLFALYGSTFVVSEWEQAIVVELGKPVRNINEAGLHFKLPLIQDVVRFEKRLLEYDADPRELLTGDKQQVVVDNYSRWKIVNPLLFYQSVTTINGALSRLDDVIYSALREVLGKSSLKDLISLRRSELTDEALVTANDKAKAFGIVIVDIRIKRADLPAKNERNIFARMRTERERLAKKFRAEGEEQAQIIRSTAQKKARIIRANAKKKSEIIRGQGDAGSTRIYSRAYNQDADFYRFVRQLETYKKVFKDNTTILISPDSALLQTFKAGK